MPPSPDYPPPGGATDHDALAALPDAVRGQIEDLVGVLTECPDVVAVVLVGSAARGELAAADVAGRLELFSDLELLAVTDGRLPGAVRGRLAAEVHALGESFGYGSSLFHAEVAFRERRRLRTMVPNVFTHELGTHGRVVHGPDVIPEVRRVTIGNLDMQNTHEILMKRLWALAEAVPVALLRSGELSEVALRSVGVAAARNALDVPTVLLPEAGVLLGTYARRVEHWASHPDLPFRARLDKVTPAGSANYLQRCLADRQAAAPAHDALVAVTTAAAFIAGAIGWLVDAPDDAIAQQVLGRARSTFHELPITPGEILGLTRQLTSNLRRRPVTAVRWAVSARKGRLAAALVELHGALAPAVQGQGDDVAVRLGRALGYIGPASLDAIDARAATADDPGAAWLAARRVIGRSFWRGIRLGDPLAWTRIERALEA